MTSPSSPSRSMALSLPNTVSASNSSVRTPSTGLSRLQHTAMQQHQHLMPIHNRVRQNGMTALALGMQQSDVEAFNQTANSAFSLSLLAPMHESKTMTRPTSNQRPMTSQARTSTASTTITLPRNAMSSLSHSPLYNSLQTTVQSSPTHHSSTRTFAEAMIQFKHNAILSTELEKAQSQKSALEVENAILRRMKRQQTINLTNATHLHQHSTESSSQNDVDPALLRQAANMTFDELLIDHRRLLRQRESINRQCTNLTIQMREMQQAMDLLKTQLQTTQAAQKAQSTELQQSKLKDKESQSQIRLLTQLLHQSEFDKDKLIRTGRRVTADDEEGEYGADELSPVSKPSRRDLIDEVQRLHAVTQQLQSQVNVEHNRFEAVSMELKHEREAQDFESLKASHAREMQEAQKQAQQLQHHIDAQSAQLLSHSQHEQKLMQSIQQLELQSVRTRNEAERASFAHNEALQEAQTQRLEATDAVSHAQHDLRQLQAVNEQLNIESESRQAALEQMQERVIYLEAKEIKCGLEHVSLTAHQSVLNELHDAQAKHEAFVNAAATSPTERQMFAAREADLLAQIDALRAEAMAVQSTLQSTRDETVHMNDTLKQLQDSRRDAERQRANEEAEAHDSVNALQRLKSELASVTFKSQEQTIAAGKLAAQLAKLNATQESDKAAAHKAHQAAMDELNAKLQRMTDKLAALRTEHGHCAHAQADLAAQLEAEAQLRKAQLKSARELRRRLEAQVATLEAQMKLLKSAHQSIASSNASKLQPGSAGQSGSSESGAATPSGTLASTRATSPGHGASRSGKHTDDDDDDSGIGIGGFHASGSSDADVRPHSSSTDASVSLQSKQRSGDAAVVEQLVQQIQILKLEKEKLLQDFNKLKQHLNSQPSMQSKP